MRKFLSIIGAAILFFVVYCLIHSGGVILFDFWTEVAVGLTLLAIGILYWGFKPEIDHLIKNKREDINHQLPKEIDPILFKEMDELMSTEEMRKKRKIIYENAKIIKQGKDISEKLAETIDYVAVHHDRVAVLIHDKDDFRKKLMDWSGYEVMIKTWDIIESYIQQDRIKRKNPKHVLHYEQLVNEYKKIKGIS